MAQTLRLNVYYVMCLTRVVSDIDTYSFNFHSIIPFLGIVINLDVCVSVLCLMFVSALAVYHRDI